MKIAFINKKGLLFLLFTLCFSELSSTQKQVVPEWLYNTEETFPHKSYIVQIGEGDSIEFARNDAASKISQYLESTVHTTIESHLLKTDTFSKKDISVSTFINSNIKLIGLSYSESFYDKKQKKYYVAGFINRNDAWNIYQPQIELERERFNLIFQKAEKENDLFQKIKYFQEANKQGTELLLKLEYGRLISPEKESVYTNERLLVASIQSRILENQQLITFGILNETNCPSRITECIKSELNKIGFKTVQTGKAIYLINPVLEYNLHKEEDLIVMNPVLTVSAVGLYRDLFITEFTIDEVVASSEDIAKSFVEKDFTKVMQEKLNEFLEF